jgi:hypothetical protein
MCERDKAENMERPQNLADFLLNSPLAGLDLQLERNQSLTPEEGLFDEEE